MQRDAWFPDLPFVRRRYWRRLAVAPLERLSLDDVKKSKLEFAVDWVPQASRAVVELSDDIFRKRALLWHSDCVFMVENEALYVLCHHARDIELRTDRT
jgi:hypothetical protein